MRQVDMLRQNQWRDMNDISSQNILKQKLIDNEEDLNLHVALSNRAERMRTFKKGVCDTHGTAD